MGVEIEKKFLVHKDRWDAVKGKGVMYTQGYLLGQWHDNKLALVFLYKNLILKHSSRYRKRIKNRKQQLLKRGEILLRKYTVQPPTSDVIIASQLGYSVNYMELPTAPLRTGSRMIRPLRFIIGTNTPENVPLYYPSKTNSTIERSLLMVESLCWQLTAGNSRSYHRCNN